jgi:hypothetical protein
VLRQEHFAVAGCDVRVLCACAVCPGGRVRRVVKCVVCAVGLGRGAWAELGSGLCRGSDVGAVEIDELLYLPGNFKQRATRNREQKRQLSECDSLAATSEGALATEVRNSHGRGATLFSRDSIFFGRPRVDGAVPRRPRARAHLSRIGGPAAMRSRRRIGDVFREVIGTWRK